MKKQGPRVRARDSRGRPSRNLYIRDGRFSFGWMENGTRRTETLQATTRTEALRERDSRLAAIREGRVAAKDDSTFGTLFDEWQDAQEPLRTHSGIRAVRPRSSPADHEGSEGSGHLGVGRGARPALDERHLLRVDL